MDFNSCKISVAATICCECSLTSLFALVISSSPAGLSPVLPGAFLYLTTRCLSRSLIHAFLSQTSIPVKQPKGYKSVLPMHACQKLSGRTSVTTACCSCTTTSRPSSLRLIRPSVEERSHCTLTQTVAVKGQHFPTPKH